MILIYLISVLFSGFVQLGSPLLSTDSNIHEINSSIDYISQFESLPHQTISFKETHGHGSHAELVLSEYDVEDKLSLKNFNKKHFQLSFLSLSIPQIIHQAFPLNYKNKSWQVHAVPSFIWNQVFRL